MNNLETRITKNLCEEAKDIQMNKKSYYYQLFYPCRWPVRFFLLFLVFIGVGIAKNHAQDANDFPVIAASSVASSVSLPEGEETRGETLPEQEQAPKEEDWAETAKYIIDQFKEEGKEATIEALIISYRESKWNKRALNDNGEKGIDRGVWQINSKWHPNVKDECAFDVVCATREAKRIWREWKGWTAWVASDRLWLLSRIIK